MSPVDYGAAGQRSPEATLIVVYGVAFVLVVETGSGRLKP